MSMPTRQGLDGQDNHGGRWWWWWWWLGGVGILLPGPPTSLRTQLFHFYHVERKDQVGLGVGWGGGGGGAGERGFSTLKGLVLLYCLYACWWPKYFGHTVLPVTGAAPDTKTATVYTLASSLWVCTVQPLPLWLWPKCFYP